MKRIKSARALRQSLAAGQRGFRILLNGGLYSRKTITPCSDGRFEVVNHIDDCVQKLSEKELHTFSNIGKAMRMGAFVAELPDDY